MKVSWDDYSQISQYMGKIGNIEKKTNHQPVVATDCHNITRILRWAMGLAKWLVTGDITRI